MSKMLKVFLALLLTNSLNAQHCEIDHLKSIHDDLQSPSLEVVDSFFASFHPVCSSNVEFSEWSNELLYDLLERKPLLFLHRLALVEAGTIKYIISQIAKPSREEPLECVYKRVQETATPNEIKNEILVALETAAVNDGIVIDKGNE